MSFKTSARSRTGQFLPDSPRLHRVERLEPRTLFAAADLDPGFSGDGRAVVDYVASRDEGSSAVAVMADGRVLVAGNARITSSFDVPPPKPAVARYLPDGRPDTTFGRGGSVRLADFGYEGDVRDLAVFPDGSFIAAGARYVSDPRVSPYPIPYQAAMKFTAAGAPDPAWRGFGTDVRGAVEEAIPLAGGRSLLAGSGVAKLNPDGTPDTTFGGGDGRAGAELITYAAAVQADGSIVVAGQTVGFGPSLAALARLTPAGEVDTAFGFGGRADFNAGVFWSVLVQPDGRIVAGGGGSTAAVVVRVNPDGTDDATFGSNGTLTIDRAATGGEWVTNMVRRSDGSIVAGGSSGAAPYLARVTATGRLDAAFGGDGVVEQLLPVGWTSPSGAGVALGSDGRLIVASGGRPTLNDTADITLTRHNNDGSRDTTFGGGAAGGVVRADFTGPLPRRVGRSALQADGKVLLTGSQTNAPASFLLLRLGTNGAPDAAFGGRGDGVAVADFGEAREFARDVAVQADGKLVVVGRVDDGEAPGDPATHPGDYAVARFTANGQLDTTFGTGGRVRTNFGGTGEGFSHVAVQSDGKIVAAGSSGNLGSQRAAVVRYLANGQLDTGFGAGGLAVVDAPGGGDQIAAILPLAGGGMLLAGSAGGDRFVARLTGNGAPDPAFGTAGTGFVVLDSGSASATTIGLVVGAGGQLYVGGTVASGTYSSFMVTRLSAAGVVDTTFGTGGTAGRFFDLATLTAFTAAPGGQFLVTGTVHNGQTGSFDQAYNFLLARFNANGAIDATFGAAGSVKIPMGSPRDAASDVHVDASGRIIVTGASMVGRHETEQSLLMNHWAVARLKGSGPEGPPAVADAQFIPTAGRHVLRLTFNKDVYDSLSAGRRVVVRKNPPALVANYPSSEYVVTRGTPGGPTTVDIVFSGTSALPNGNYRATMLNTDVTDSQGNPMAVAFSFDFFVLAGDVNRNRIVDSSDFALLAGNFGKTGTFEKGDLNGDTRVDASDFAILAGNFGKAVPAPAAVVAPAAVTAPLRAGAGAGTSVARQTRAKPRRTPPAPLAQLPGPRRGIRRLNPR